MVKKLKMAWYSLKLKNSFKSIEPDLKTDSQKESVFILENNETIKNDEFLNEKPLGF